MQVRCKLIRPEGTQVDFPVGGPYGPAGQYHFAPNKKGDHVAEVEDADHLAFFLSEKTGYELYDPSGKKKLVIAPSDPVEVKPENPLDPLVPEKGE